MQTFDFGEGCISVLKQSQRQSKETTLERLQHHTEEVRQPKFEAMIGPRLFGVIKTEINTIFKEIEQALNQ